MMRIDEWVSFAKGSSVDEFTTRWPAPFLMSEIVGATAHDVQYGHMTIDTHAPPVQVLPNTLPEMIQAAPLRVEPIIKSARNPFNDRIFVGRAKNTDLVLENESVSKVHAYFEPCSDGGWLIRDFGSRNGTRLGTQLLEPHVPVKLGSLVALRFGRYRAFFVAPTVLHTLLRQRIVDEPSNWRFDDEDDDRTVFPDR